MDKESKPVAGERVDAPALPVVAYGYENTRPIERAPLMMVKLSNTGDQYPELAVPLVRKADAEAAIAAAAGVQGTPVLNALEVLERTDMPPGEIIEVENFLRIMGEANLWVIASPLTAGVRVPPPPVDQGEQHG